VGLVLRGHPRTNTFVKEDVLGVERFEFRVFRSAGFLRDKVVGTEVQGQTDNADSTHPESGNRNKEHEEVQPTLVGESDTENLRPETVCCHHGVGFFFLGGRKRLKGVGALTIFKQSVLNRRTVNRTEQRATENTRNAHHVEGVEGPVVEALQEQQAEIDALKAAGHSVAEEHQQYSINENMLGVTLSGQEIDTFEQPGPDTWHWARPRAEWPEDPLSLTIQFEHGIAIGLNGKTMTGPDILSALNETMGAYGVGRHIYTGDVSIGLKGRIVFECPGVDALLVAHQALEDAVNSKFQNQFRNLIADRWADLVYQGFFYDPHKDDLEAYLQSSQQFVNGAVTLTTHGGVVHATDIDSKWILHNESATYAQSCDWTSSEAEGFIKLVGQSSTLASRVRQKGGVQS